MVRGLQLWRALLALALFLCGFGSVPDVGRATQLADLMDTQSMPVPIEAQAVARPSIDHYAFDASAPTPNARAFYRVDISRPPLDHMLVPKAVFDRIKANALHNPLAPFNPNAEPFSGEQSTITPLPLITFAGLNDFLYHVEPPDMALAVSPNWVVQGVNRNFAVFDRTGHKQAGWPQSFERFFQVPSPGPCNPTPYLFDPRAFYIRADQRFVLGVAQIDGPIIFTTCAPLSKYWIAVSQTNNPNGKWNIYSFDMLDGSNVADFTQIGYDANGIYFSGNLYNTSKVFQYAEIFGASKARMEAGLSVTAHGYTKLKAAGKYVDSVHPVASLTQPPLVVTQPVEYFINSKNILTCTALCSGVTVWAFANLLNTPSLSAANIATTTYSTPPNAAQPGQGLINTGDQRISGMPVYQGGLISFGLNTAVTQGTSTNAGMFWGQVRPTLSGTTITGGSVFQSGYLSFAGDRSGYYPALVPDSRGNLFVVFGSSSSTSYASAYYRARKSTDAPGTFAHAVTLFGGQAIYQFLRWGDYSAAAVDGNLTTSEVWLAAEYVAPDGDWATEIGATRFP